MHLPRYLVPACVALFLFGTAFSLRDVRGKSERKPRSDRPADFGEIVDFPHGRVLTLVVDEKAVFIGEDPIPFEVFGDFLRVKKEEIRPDYVIVYGTDLARYGKVVEVYAAIRDVWAIPEQIITRPIPIGMRFQAIKVCEHYWDYDLEEEEEPNQAPEPTTTLVTPRAGARVAPSAVVAHL